MIFGRGFTTFSLTDAHNLPQFSPSLSKTIYSRGRTITKDAREKLSFVVQVHHIDDTGLVYINKGFAAENGLVGGDAFSNTVYALLNIRPHNKEIIGFDDIIQQGSAGPQEVSSQLRLPTITNTMSTTAKSTAMLKPLGSGRFKVLYWVKEEVPQGATSKQLYLNIRNDY